jgi:hypothetical protein
MKYSMVNLSDLKTSVECDEAIEQIENNWHNYQGGLDRWLSGYDTILLSGAKAKVAALRKRSDRLYQAECKAAGITFEDDE